MLERGIEGGVGKPIGDECKVVLMKGIRWVGEEGWADYRVKPIGDECKVVL